MARIPDDRELIEQIQIRQIDTFLYQKAKSFPHLTLERERDLTFARVTRHSAAQSPPEEQRSCLQVVWTPGCGHSTGGAAVFLGRLLFQQLRTATMPYHRGPAYTSWTNSQTVSRLRTKTSHWRLQTREFVAFWKFTRLAGGSTNSLNSDYVTERPLNIRP